MATAATLTSTIGLPTASAPTGAPLGKGFLRIFFSALIESRRRQAEAEIARHIGFSDKMTDDMERKLSNAFMKSGRPFI